MALKQGQEKDAEDLLQRTTLQQPRYADDADDLVQEAYARVKAYEQTQVVKSREAMLVTTEKDFVRFPEVPQPETFPICFLRVEIEVVRGKEVFDRMIRVLSPALRRR